MLDIKKILSECRTETNIDYKLVLEKYSLAQLKEFNNQSRKSNLAQKRIFHYIREYYYETYKKGYNNDIDDRIEPLLFVLIQELVEEYECFHERFIAVPIPALSQDSFKKIVETIMSNFVNELLDRPEKYLPRSFEHFRHYSYINLYAHILEELDHKLLLRKYEYRDYYEILKSAEKNNRYEKLLQISQKKVGVFNNGIFEKGSLEDDSIVKTWLIIQFKETYKEYVKNNPEYDKQIDALLPEFVYNLNAWYWNFEHEYLLPDILTIDELNKEIDREIEVVQKYSIPIDYTDFQYNTIGYFHKKCFLDVARELKRRINRQHQNVGLTVNQAKKGVKADLIRILRALYELNYFPQTTWGNTVKTFESFLGIDLGQYESILNKALNRSLEANFSIFEKQKEAIRKLWDKNN